MSYHDEESSDIGPVGQSKLESFLFSCELSSKVPFYTFQGDEEEDLEHFLELRTVCLGEGCKEESNVVEVTAMNHQGKTISVPIANLHTNCLPMVSLGEFELKAPVTIRLKAGTGPVTVSGLHLIAPPSASSRNQPSSAALGPDASAAETKPLEPKQAHSVTPASGSRNSSPDCLASCTPDEVSDSVCASDEECVTPPKKDSSGDEYSSFPGDHKMEDEDDNLMEIEGVKRVSSPDSLASSSPDEDSDSVCSSDEWDPSAEQDSSEDEYSIFPGDYKIEDEDDNLTEIEEKWVSKNKSIKWSPSDEQTYRYVQAPTKPVPGLTKYAKRNITDELKSCLDLFLTNGTIQLILKMTNLEGKRTEKLWKDITETELRGFLGLLLLAGVYRSRGESTLSLWEEPIGRPVFRGTMSRKKFELIATKLRFDDKLTRRKRLSNNKLAAILPVWEPWVQRLSRAFNPGADVCVDEQLVGFKGRCSFRQYMPSKPAKYGIKIWTLADVSTSYAWNMAIYAGKEEASREVGQGKRVVLQMTQGLAGRTVTIDNFFTSYELGTELLQRKLAMVGTVRKGKPELPPQILNVSDREVLSSLFAHTATHTVVSYVPKKGKNVLLMSTKHREASISEEAHKKPMIILNYNKCKGGVDNLDKCVGTYSCRRKTSRWPLTVFYNMLDVSAYNSFVLWTCLHPKWEIQKKYRRRIFLELLGKELVIPCILERERIPRGPSAAAFVQAAQAAMMGKKEVHSEDVKEVRLVPLSPGAGAQANLKKRRPCELCPESMKKSKVRNFCAKCGIFLCKDHTWKGCGTCLAGGQ